MEVQVIGELLVDDPAAVAGQAHLSAASGLVWLGNRLYVVADDEHHLAVFDLPHATPGRQVRLFEGELPTDPDARKAAKPDCEALILLPAFGPCPEGALLALGSGSRPTRDRGAWMALDASGELQGPVRTIDMAPLLRPLRERFADLNIEGGFVHGDTLSLLQRGNGRSAVNARIDLAWEDMRHWLAAQGPAPEAAAITRFDLGSIDGIPLSFTDGAALPDGRWLFSASAEDTTDPYLDGRCAGTVVGLVDAGGTIRSIERVALTVKVEGIAGTATGDSIELLMVTDGDDRRRPGLLLSATWRR